jgi:hypothetical protein
VAGYEEPDSIAYSMWASLETAPQSPRGRENIAESVWWPLAPVLASLLLGLALYPGRWTPDPVTEFHEIRTGDFTDWYAPVFHAILLPSFRVFPHPGVMLAAQLVLVTLSFYGVARALFSRRTSAVLATLLLIYPPIIGWGVVISRDVWYAGLLLALTAITRLVLEAPTGSRARIALVGCGLALLFLVCSTRQNGFLGAVPILLLAIWTLSAEQFPGLRSRLWTRSVLTAATTVVLTGAMLLAINVSTYDILHARRTALKDTLYVFDIAAVSHRTDSNLFSRESLRPDLYDEVEAAYSPVHVWGLIWGPQAVFTGDLAKRDSSLRADWLRAIRSHPLDYLAARVAIFRALIGMPPARPMWTYVSAAESRPFAKPWLTRPSRVFDRYVERFSQSDLQRSIFYVIAVVVFAAVGWRLGREHQVVAAFGLGSLLYLLSFFFLANGADNRYNWVVIIAGVLSVAGLTNVAITRMRGMRLPSRRSLLQE